MELLGDFIIVFLSSIILLLILSRLKIPSVIGFLLTGLIVGKAGFSVIHAGHEIEVLSEVGVMLLMFTVGLEFSLNKFKEMKREVLVYGSLQMIITLVFVLVLSSVTSFSLPEKILAGFIIPLSSTAIVLKILQDRQLLGTPAGKIMTGVLLFQDLCVVPLIIFTPVLGTLESIDGIAIAMKLLQSLLLIIVILTSAKFLLPKIFDFVVSARVSELFLILILGLCFGLALLTNYLGFSSALGAFIAGMILAESDYLHQIEADVKPLKTVFLSIFFITVGMLLNVDYVLDNPLKILAGILFILSLKAIIVLGVLTLFKIPKNNALLSGLGLAQIGEFAFMLLNIAKPLEIIGEDFYQLLLSVSVISMLLTPLLLKVGYKAGGIQSLKKNISEKKSSLEKHVIIAGFGINGINLSKIFKTLNIPYLIIEINPQTIKKYKKLGENIVYGDLTQPDNLKNIGIERAEMIIIAISDAAATSKAVKISRKLNPEIKIIVRSEFITQIESLYHKGANTVISQDFEASLEISSYVLRHYGISDPMIRLKSEQLRDRHYKFFSKKSDFSVGSLKLAELASIEYFHDSFSVLGNRNLIGKSVIHINEKLSNSVDTASILGLVRGNNIIKENIDDLVIEEQDSLIVYARQEALDAAMEWLGDFNE